jgi:hypothetical protein
MNYQEFNVTNYLPTYAQLVETYTQRRGKSSKARFINSYLKESYETREDLKNALNTSPVGMLHGAKHTKEDIKKLDKHIENLLTLKEFTKWDNL